jgi:Cu/Zn superoxide dismutase
MRSSTRKYSALAAAALLGLAAACGGDTEEATEGAPAVAAAEPRRAVLEPVGGWAQIHPEGTGTVEVAADEDGTTVTLAVSGLDPETEYPAHVHDGACDADPPGGRHWRADPDSDGQGRPDHLHTYVLTDAEGAGEMSMESDLVADERAVSVVVHAGGSNEWLEQAGADRIFCGDLTAE